MKTKIIMNSVGKYIVKRQSFPKLLPFIWESCFTTGAYDVIYDITFDTEESAIKAAKEWLENYKALQLNKKLNKVKKDLYKPKIING